ncbi:MAG TPA: VanW family protein [Patescibacteria group bacterium]|nr:VanW family protein [Patescibacteria group bacterium]
MSFLPSLRFSFKPFLLGAGIFFSVLIIGVVGLAVFFYGYDKMYSDRILPGISATGVPLDGLTESQAKSVLIKHLQEATASGLRFRLENETIILPINVKSKTEALVSYDVNTAVKNALEAGHTGSWWRDGFTRLRIRFYRLDVPIPVHVQTQLIEKELQDRLAPGLPTVQNAVLHVTISGVSSTPVIAIDPERQGKSIDLDPVIGMVEQQADQIEFQPIVIPEITIEPEWTAKDIEPLTSGIPDLLRHAPFSLAAGLDRRTIDKATLASWINVATSTDGLQLVLDPDRLDSTLKSFLSSYIDQPKNGKLVMEDGKIASFDPPIDGTRFDAEGTINDIQNGWANGSSTIPVRLIREPAQVLGSDAADLGVSELLGIGRSNFSGSPVNRRKNIALGAQKVNQTLVAPNEEFSLLKVLGEIDDKHGWLPELVIKGDKTTPEFGGGLCQIGTTMFRAALASGMPITQRQNHSYRVRYYEPAGTDATIYVPAPDFRFKNDTGHWLLISTRIKGDDLLFSIWGTPDGRKVIETDPKISNIVPPPPKKIIETLDLPPGTTKCTETAHSGADARFDYTIAYANGNSHKTTFASHYKPWGAVCLLGVKQLTASSTASTSQKIDETGINNPN